MFFWYGNWYGELLRQVNNKTKECATGLLVCEQMYGPAYRLRVCARKRPREISLLPSRRYTPCLQIISFVKELNFDTCLFVQANKNNTGKFSIGRKVSELNRVFSVT